MRSLKQRKHKKNNSLRQYKKKKSRRVSFGNRRKTNKTNVMRGGGEKYTVVNNPIVGNKYYYYDETQKKYIEGTFKKIKYEQYHFQSYDKFFIFENEIKVDTVFEKNNFNDTDIENDIKQNLIQIKEYNKEIHDKIEELITNIPTGNMNDFLKFINMYNKLPKQ